MLLPCPARASIQKCDIIHCVASISPASASAAGPAAAAAAAAAAGTAAADDEEADELEARGRRLLMRCSISRSGLSAPAWTRLSQPATGHLMNALRRESRPWIAASACSAV